jgi:glycosyltransferase involved in cell wall biosynthesis
MRLTLDLSPMLVNRTAAFHICRAVIDALAEHQPGLQYLGEAVTTPPEGDEIKRLKGKLEAMLVLAAEADRPLIMPPSPARGPYDRCVFLDPLYVLFSDLSGGDMVLIHDLSPVTTPGWHRPEVARLYELALAKIAKAAPQLLAVSANSAETYHANYGYPRRPIRVVPLFVPDHVHPGGGVLKTSRAYFLFVGSLEARKNVLGAIEAFRLSGLASKGYDLLLVGGHGHDAEAVLRAGGATPGVIFHGFVEDAEIAGVYEGATGFVYPSYLEGFGVPLLEALMHGVPAVASITGACSEVGGDLVAYCNPDDHLAIARELQRIASMTVAERAAFAVRARRRVAEHFSLAAFTANICDAVLAA